MQPTSSALPRWDVTSIYPSLESGEFRTDFQAAIDATEQLTAFFDQAGVQWREPPPLDEDTVRCFETILEKFNAVSEQVATVDNYLYSLTIVESTNDEARARQSEFQSTQARLGLLMTRLIAWIGSLDVDELVARSLVAQEHSYLLYKAKIQAQHLLAPAEEALVSEMRTTGSTSWTDMWMAITSQITVPFTIQGEEQALPMSSLRKLAYDPDRAVRQRAYEAEITAWQGISTPLVSALNSILGERNLLVRRRGWNSPLAPVLVANHVDHRMVDALVQAVREALPDLQRYLRAKARALNLPILTWYDLNAPIFTEAQPWPFDAAQHLLIEQFSHYSPRFGSLVARAFQERWIDAEPRPGKLDVSMMIAMRREEFRILVNYRPVFYEVVILAHELGHAYHHYQLQGQRSMLQQRVPLTLAETASIFSQTLIQQAALSQADARQQILMLDTTLQLVYLLVFQMAGLFLLEKELYAKRQQRALSLAEIQTVSGEIQDMIYGNSLESATRHPFEWTLYPHLFIASYYNFQYAFGYLFALGLYARYQEDSASFLPQFDALLSRAGMAGAAELAEPFGIDLTSPAFWHTSLDVIRKDIDRFEAAIAETQTHQPSSAINGTP